MMADRLLQIQMDLTKNDKEVFDVEILAVVGS
jgi:hypothetical protein